MLNAHSNQYFLPQKCGPACSCHAHPGNPVSQISIAQQSVQMMKDSSTAETHANVHNLISHFQYRIFGGTINNGGLPDPKIKSLDENLDIFDQLIKHQPLRFVAFGCHFCC